MKKKLWVKVAAFALALTLLWMNMADVRNILDANAEAEDSEEVNEDELKFGEISIEELTDQDTVTISVPILSGTADNVKLILMSEGSGEPHQVNGELDEETNIWTAVLSSVSETEWMKDGKVFVASFTATDVASGENVSAIVAEEADTSATADTALYCFTVKSQNAEGDGLGDDPSKTPEENDPDQNEENDEAALSVGKISISIEGGKETASEGDTVIVLVEVNGGDGNETVTAAFGMEGSDDMYPEPLIYDSDANVYKLEMNVTEDGWMKSGKVYIASVTATDESGNEVKGLVAEDGADSANVDTASHYFIVEMESTGEDDSGDGTQKEPEQNVGADVTKPVIEDIIMEPQVGETVTDGDTVKIRIKAYDTGDGIESIRLELKNEYSNYSYGVDVTYDKAMQTGEVVLNVSEKDWLKGKVYIYQISVIDQMGNPAYGDVDSRSADIRWASVDSAKYWFIADRGDIDTQKPEIQEVKLTPNGGTVKPGDKVELQVMAKDDVALKTRNGCTVWLLCEESNSNQNSSRGVSLDWDQDKECYCGTLEITESLYPGKWKVWYAEVTDIAENEVEYYPENITFTIQQDEDYDKVLPQVKSVQMEKTGEILKAGDSVLLSVEATDDKEIEYLRVDLTASVANDLDYSAGHKAIRLERVEGTDRYEGSFEINEQTYPCEWYVDKIYIRDTSGNYRYINSCNSGEYVENLYYGTYSEDSYSLEEKFYVMVWKDGTLNPNVTVYVDGALVKVSEDSWWYDSYGRTVQVPRRAALSEVEKLFGTVETPEGLTFEGWMPGRGSSGNGEDPMILWKGNSAYAKYDKNIIVLGLCDRDDEDGNEVYRNVIFGKEGDTLPLPKEIPGLCNIKWESYIDGEFIVIDNVLVGNEPVKYIYGSAELDPDTPVTPDAPVTPDTPAEPSNDGPVTLSYQKIAEVVAEIAAAGNGAVVTVNMGDATVVPKEILEAAKGKDVKVVLEMDGYIWTIDGRDILSGNLKDVNLKVIRNTDYIPSGLISQLAGTNPVEQITLEYNGDFGFTADLTINIGSQHAGKTGSLYWHDSDGRMIFMNAGSIDTAGNVTLGFSHASDYAVVITGPVATAAPNAAAVSITKPTAVAVKTGDTTPIAFYAILLVAALAVCGVAVCAVAAYRKKASRRDS